MSNGDRIKYDYISGREYNVTEEEAAIEAFLAANSNDSDKVQILRTAEQGGKNLRQRRVKNTIKVDDKGKVKMRVSVYKGADRYRDRGLKTDEEIRAEKREAERQARNAERRRRRAERLAADSSEN